MKTKKSSNNCATVKWKSCKPHDPGRLRCNSEDIIRATKVLSYSLSSLMILNTYLSANNVRFIIYCWLRFSFNACLYSEVSNGSSSVLACSHRQMWHAGSLLEWISSVYFSQSYWTCVSGSKIFFGRNGDMWLYFSSVIPKLLPALEHTLPCVPRKYSSFRKLELGRWLNG